MIISLNYVGAAALTVLILFLAKHKWEFVKKRPAAVLGVTIAAIAICWAVADWTVYKGKVRAVRINTVVAIAVVVFMMLAAGNLLFRILHRRQKTSLKDAAGTSDVAPRRSKLVKKMAACVVVMALVAVLMAAYVALATVQNANLCTIVYRNGSEVVTIDEKGKTTRFDLDRTAHTVAVEDSAEGTSVYVVKNPLGEINFVVGEDEYCVCEEPVEPGGDDPPTEEAEE